jgi:hypothetical protein
MQVPTHSTSESRSARARFRQHPRAFISVPILLRHLSHGGVRSTRGISLDLGMGGLGAMVQGEVEVGDTVSIDFELSQGALTTVAIVRHTSSTRSGFEFVGLTVAELGWISIFVGTT